MTGMNFQKWFSLKPDSLCSGEIQETFYSLDASVNQLFSNSNSGFSSRRLHIQLMSALNIHFIQLVVWRSPLHRCFCFCLLSKVEVVKSYFILLSMQSNQLREKWFGKYYSRDVFLFRKSFNFNWKFICKLKLEQFDRFCRMFVKLHQ